MKQEQLTSAEMGKLWAAYLGNSLGECTLTFYLQHVEDREIKKILAHSLNLTKSFQQQINKIFNQVDFPVPVAFSIDKDVNLDAPRLFRDEFYLYYLQYLGKAGMSIYSVAIPLVSKKYVRDFFIEALDGAVRLISTVNDVLKSKGLFMDPPQMPSPQQVEFVEKQLFLNDIFGKQRPVHGMEVAHLYGNINNDTVSKALMIGLIQVAKREEVRKYLERGIQINQRHIKALSEKLNNNNVPSPTLLDYLVTTSTTPTFSDKLIIFHKIDMFSMKIREYADGMSLNGRKDIGSLFAKCQLDVSLFVEDGANILIDHGWMEQPPFVIDRNKLASKE